MLSWRGWKGGKRWTESETGETCRDMLCGCAQTRHRHVVTSCCVQVKMTSAEVMAKTVGVPASSCSSCSSWSDVTVGKVSCDDCDVMWTPIKPKNKVQKLMQLASTCINLLWAVKVWFSWLLLLFLVATSLPLLVPWRSEGSMKSHEKSWKHGDYEAYETMEKSCLCEVNAKHLQSSLGRTGCQCMLQAEMWMERNLKVPLKQHL